MSRHNPKTVAVKVYKQRSAYFQGFLLILGSCLIVVAINYMLWQNKDVNDMVESVNQSNIAMLNGVSESFDQMLLFVDQNVDSFRRNGDVINLLVMPGMDNYDRNRRVTLEMERMALQKYYASMEMYHRWLEVVFSSNGTAVPLADSSYDSLFRYCYGQDNKAGFGGDEKSQTRLVYFEDQLYAIREWPRNGDYSMCVISFRLDLEELYKNILPTQERSDGVFYVLGNDNMVIMATEKDSVGRPFAYDIPEDEDRITVRKDDGKITSIYQPKSAYSGIRIVFEAAKDIRAFEKQNVTRRLLPSMAILVIAVAMIAFFGAEMIYRPVRKLFNLLVSYGGKEEDEQGKSEYDFFNITYRNVLQKREYMNELVKETQDTIAERQLYNLLTGAAAADTESLWQLFPEMDGIGLPDICVIVTKVRDYTQVVPENKSESSERSLWAFSTRAILEKQLSEAAFCYRVVLIDSKSYAVGVAKPPNMTGEKAHDLLMKQIEAAENEFAEMLPFIVLVGVSTQFISPLELSLAYEEALNQVHYEEYLSSSGVTIKSMELPIFSQRLENEANSMIRKNEFSRLNTFLWHYTESGIVLPPEKQRNYLEGYLIILNSLAQYAAEEEIDVPGLKPAREMVFQQFNTEPELARTANAIEQVIEDIQKKLKEKYRKPAVSKYCSKAMEYIDNHYKDSGLNLESVAEAVGTSAAYLSRIFKENTGSNFLQYLNGLRILKAKQLLENTSLSVQEIGFRVGFASAQHFIRSFKKFEGCTPGSYRENKMEQNDTR